VSLRRWAGTTAVMCAVAWALWSLGPGPAELHAALADPQGLVDQAGADALLLVVVPVLAWLCWAWGALGLLLTAASTLPGWTGRLAGLLLAGVLPAGARRAAAVALGLSLGVTAPAVLLPTASPIAVATAAAADDLATPEQVVIDWPAAPARKAAPTWPSATPDWPSAALDRPSTVPDRPSTVPDWPRSTVGDHVVVRGDCLWDVAAAWLQRQEPGTPVSDTDVQRAVQAWWQVNSAVIGPDPDLLLPGQVLRPPG
jgi:nucleoid-associated protein YgaU